jgi:hypothetical protein
MKCRNSAFNAHGSRKITLPVQVGTAHGSRKITLPVQVGTVKIYVAAETRGEFSAFNAQGSRRITLPVHVGTVKIYVAAETQHLMHEVREELHDLYR